MPRITVITRKAYGRAYVVMSSKHVGGGDPTCVAICPTGAIRFEEPDAAPSRTRHAWAAFLLASSAEKPTAP